jgi:hypothetical protein
MSAMIKAHKRKAALVALHLMTVLLVSSCYMSPNDITGDNNNLPQGGDNVPTLPHSARWLRLRQHLPRRLQRPA